MPIFSHSRLSCYEKCKLQYRYRYLDKIRRKVQSIEAFLGSRVHEVLEHLYRDIQKSRTPSCEELLALYQESWDRSYRDDIRIVRQERTAEYYRDLGTRYIRDFYGTYKPFQDGSTAGLEEKVVFPLDEEGKYRVQGFVDRIVRLEAGVYEIHDYKTGNSVPSPKEIQQDRQLAFYQIGVQRKFPEAKKIKLVWHYLAFNKEISSQRTPEALERLKKKTMQQIQSIEETRDYPPTESALCRWCEYLDICPLWQDRVETPALSRTTLAPVSRATPRQDPGVQLVDRLEAAESARKEADQDLTKARQEVLKFAEKRGLDVVEGTNCEVRIRQEEQLCFPEPGETGRRGLEMVLKEMKQYNRLARLDGEALSRLYADPETDRYLKTALDQFVRREPRRRLRLVSKTDRQLDLFE